MSDLNKALEDIQLVIDQVLPEMESEALIRVKRFLKDQRVTGVVDIKLVSAIEPHYMTLFPHMDSLQSCVDMVISQLPLNNKNAAVGALLTYHNTLLKVLENEKDKKH